MAPIALESRGAGETSGRIADRSLQAQPSADGRRHLHDGAAAARRYRNLDVSVLNAEGLGVVRGRGGVQVKSAPTRTAHP